MKFTLIISKPKKGRKGLMPVKVYSDNIDDILLSEEDKRILEAMKNPQKGYEKN